jgi:hypothetical protein
MIGRSVMNRPSYPLVQEYRWADYLELFALKNPDGMLSVSDLKDLVNPELTDTDENIDLDSDLQVDEPDRFEQRRANYLNHFRARSSFYGDNYPFVVNDDSLVRKDTLGPAHAAYIYLLCCSSLGYVDSTSESKFTSDFELISVEYLKTVKPMSHGPWVFGKNTSGSPTRYSGNLVAKITSLAEDLRVPVVGSPAGIANTDTGDGGLDIVGWDNPWDNTTSQFVYFGNCKCSDQWLTASSPSAIVKGWFALNNGAVNLFFIPFNFRDVSNGWHKPIAVAGKVLFDRFRLLKNFPMSTFASTESYRIISEQFPIRNE